MALLCFEKEAQSMDFDGSTATIPSSSIKRKEKHVAVTPTPSVFRDASETLTPNPYQELLTTKRAEEFVDGKIVYKSCKEILYFINYIRENLSRKDTTKYLKKMLHLYGQGIWHPLNERERKIIKENLFVFQGRIGLSYQGCQANWANVPDDFFTRRREKIAIIGGGYTGVLTALLLTKLQDKEENPFYEVHLYDSNPELMMGASLAPARLHLGGEYPTDEATALQCLKSAILFRQMLRGIYTDISKTAFLLSNNSKEQLTYEEMKENYNKIKNKYGRYYTQLQNEYGENTDALFFGPPDDFFAEICDEDLPVGYKGILTQEKGLNPIYLGLTLEKLLKHFNVTLHLGSQVNSIAKVFDAKFGETVLPVHMVSTDGSSELYHQVVNSTWVDFRPIDIMCDPKNKGINSTSFIRGIMLADISQCSIPIFNGEKASIFGLLGQHGGMASPFNNHIALLYLPTPEGGHIGEHPISDNIPSMLHSFQERYKLYDVQKEGRMENILANLKQKFPFLHGARPIDLLIRETLSFDNGELEKRRHINTNNGTPAGGVPANYVRVLSTKATYCPVAALEALKLILKNSCENNPERKYSSTFGEWLDKSFGGETAESIILPAEARLPFFEKTEEFFREAEDYAERHMLPKELIYNDAFRQESK